MILSTSTPKLLLRGLAFTKDFSFRIHSCTKTDNHILTPIEILAKPKSSFSDLDITFTQLQKSQISAFLTTSATRFHLPGVIAT
jgi:hypothetical protein